MLPDHQRALKLELADAEAAYEQAKRRHERTQAAQVRAAGFSERSASSHGPYTDSSIESDDSSQTEHELREAEDRLAELRRRAAELIDEDAGSRD